jgi:hypothetical protein
MDALLKLAADAGVHVSAAEEALDEGANEAARDALDRAGDVLTELRGRWPAMSPAERAVVGGAAGAVRRRLDEAAARLPARRTLSEGTAEADPEQDEDPEAT